MRHLGKPTIVAALALAIAGTASGCIVEHRYVRDEPPAPSAPPPPTRYDDGAPRESVVESRDPGPGVDLDEDYFYDRLSPYGYWRWTPEYGRVWVPSGVAADWRPYYDGHWALTDWGWTYVSDAPWGWAAYHYGRWGFGLGLGWYWIPGSVWGPAWVSWRYGAGWVAWAPLGPAGYYWGVTSPAWVAVRERHFTQPIRTVAISAQRTASVVASTTPQPIVSRPRPIASGRVVSGPPVARVSAAVGQPLRPAPVAKVLPSAGLGRATSRAYEPGRTMGTPRGSRAGSPSDANRPRAGDRWERGTRPTNRWGEPRSSAPRSGARDGTRSYGGSRSYGTPRSYGSPRTDGGSRSYGTAPRSGGSSGGSSSPRAGSSSGGHSGGSHSSGGHSGGGKSK